MIVSSKIYFMCKKTLFVRWLHPHAGCQTPFLTDKTLETKDRNLCAPSTFLRSSWPRRICSASASCFPAMQCCFVTRVVSDCDSGNAPMLQKASPGTDCSGHKKNANVVKDTIWPFQCAIRNSKSASLEHFWIAQASNHQLGLQSHP